MAGVLVPQCSGCSARAIFSSTGKVKPQAFSSLRLSAPTRYPLDSVLSTQERVARSPRVFGGDRKFKSIVRKAQMDQKTDELGTENIVEDETCELVNRFNVTLGEGADEFQGYMVQAIKNNNGTAILFLSDVFGVDDSDTRDFAYRLACFGYNILVPDLFRGAPRSENSTEDYETWREQHSPSRVAKDINVAANWLTTEIPGTKLGILGFCFGGGRLIETLAGDESNLFSAAVFCYGTRFDVSLVGQIKIPLLIIAGDEDELCSLKTVAQMNELAKEGTKVKIYSGFGHAFVHRPKTTEADNASEEAFSEIRHWFHENLPSPSSPELDPDLE